jgi:hypothetical protein
MPSSDLTQYKLLNPRETQLDFMANSCNIDRNINLFLELMVIKNMPYRKERFGFYSQLEYTNNVHVFA